MDQDHKCFQFTNILIKMTVQVSLNVFSFVPIYDKDINKNYS